MATFVIGKQATVNYYMQPKLRTILFNVVISQRMAEILFVLATIGISIFMTNLQDNKKV
jgi:hypothetical protein